MFLPSSGQWEEVVSLSWRKPNFYTENKAEKQADVRGSGVPAPPQVTLQDANNL